MDNLISVVDWSRAQFALTAMYHWLFVPLTLGISVIVAIMETIYYRTRSERPMRSVVVREMPLSWQSRATVVP